MELIKGNMLFFIVLTAFFVFLAAWGLLYDGPFRRVFIFSRRQNLQYELCLVGKLIIGIGIAGIALYYLLCAYWHYSGVPVWYMALILLAPLTIYLLSSWIAISGMEGKVTLVVLVVMISIQGLIVCAVICIVLLHMKLDSYCGYVSGILLAADFFFGRKYVMQWKKGDIRC